MISRIHHIATLAYPDLEPYRTLRRPFEHLQQGIFVAEGEKVILRLLESPLTIRSILLTQDWFEVHRAKISSNHNSIELYIGEKKLLETIVGHDLHQSIMAVANVPSPVTIDSIAFSSQQRQLFVMVDGITNAENMGVIVRNCVCFGIQGLFVMPTSCDPYLRRSVRNSMGNIFQLPILYLSNSLEDINRLKSRGMIFYAAHPHQSSTDIRKNMCSNMSCIVFGAEGHGISKNVLDICDHFVSIKMKDGVDSLNVASASAVILYEAMNQRT